MEVTTGVGGGGGGGARLQRNGSEEPSRQSFAFFSWVPLDLARRYRHFFLGKAIVYVGHRPLFPYLLGSLIHSFLGKAIVYVDHRPLFPCL